MTAGEGIESHSGNANSNEFLAAPRGFGSVIGEAAVSLAIAGGVGIAMTKFGLDVKDQYIPRPDATPSDDLKNAFDAIGSIAPYLAGASLVAHSVDSVRHGLTRPRRALKEISQYELSDNERKSHWGRFERSVHRIRKDGRVILGLAAIGGLTAGFYNTAVETGDSQRRVPAAFAQTFGVGENSSVLCQSDDCSQANSTDLPKGQIDQMVDGLASNNINAFAIRQDYYTASTASTVGKKSKTVQSIVYGAPGTMTNLPQAETCADMKGIIDVSLGTNKGDKIRVNGLLIEVADTRGLSAGQNLIPIVVNYDDLTKCLKNQKDAAYSFVIADTDPATLQAAAEKVGLQNDGLETRAQAVMLDKYLDNSQKLGDDIGKPLILTVIAAFDIFALNGLLKDERFRGEKARTVIATLKTQHYTNREIVKTQSLRAGRLASIAVAPAFVVAAAFDYVANSGVVGSAQGTSMVSLAVGAGVIVGGSKSAARRAARKQLKSLSKDSALLQELK